MEDMTTARRFRSEKMVHWTHDFPNMLGYDITDPSIRQHFTGYVAEGTSTDAATCEAVAGGGTGDKNNLRTLPRAERGGKALTCTKDITSEL